MTLLLEQARILTRHGFSVIPIKNKIPVIKSWTDKRKQLSTEQEHITWFSNGKADSIAIAINNTEFAIDTDGECEQIFLEKVHPICSEELREKITKTTYTKTPKGYHRTFKISSEDFPEGIPERIYLTLSGEDHKHDEIALKGRNHYLVEYGPGYITINDIECLVTLTREQVNELLYRLEEISPNRDKYRRQRLDQPKQQQDQDQMQSTYRYCILFRGYRNKSDIGKATAIISAIIQG